MNRFVLVGALLASGMAGAEDFRPGDPVYNVVNLHPDTARKRLYTTNYQQDGLLLICRPMEMVTINSRRARFRDRESGVVYTLWYHSAVEEPIDAHLNKVFARECPKARVAQLSDIDRRGVAAGVAFPGMSRRGVIMAMGYPPPHATPSFETSNWIYWQSRFDRMIVRFDDDGRVVEVID